MFHRLPELKGVYQDFIRYARVTQTLLVERFYNEYLILSLKRVIVLSAKNAIEIHVDVIQELVSVDQEFRDLVSQITGNGSTKSKQIEILSSELNKIKLELPNQAQHEEAIY